MLFLSWFLAVVVVERWLSPSAIGNIFAYRTKMIVGNTLLVSWHLEDNFRKFCGVLLVMLSFVMYPFFHHIFAPQYKATSWHAGSGPNSGYHGVAHNQSQIVGITYTPLVLTSSLCKSYQIWNQFIIQPCVRSYLFRPARRYNTTTSYLKQFPVSTQ